MISGGEGLFGFLIGQPDAIAVLPLLLQLLVLFFSVAIDPHIQKGQRRMMLLISVLVLSLIAENLLSTYLIVEKYSPFERTLESIYGYAIRPVVVLLFFYLINPDRRNWLAWCLVALNAVIYLTALFSPLAFSIDELNNFHRGPLGFSCHVISAILLLYLLYLSLLELDRFRKAEALIPIVNAVLIIVAVLLDTFFIKTEIGLTFLTITTVSCCLFYYIWLHLKFVRDHEDALMMEQRVQIMLSQIQPHFLYNTLTAIGHLCRDNPEAKDAIFKFSRYLQGNMHSITQSEPIPFTTELEHTKVYLELEQLRFGEKLNVAYDLEATEFLLPTLTLQPLVENAVRHGVRGNADGAGTVTVSSREYPDHWEIGVSDDGPGFDPKKIDDDGEYHIGLQNVQERLRLVSGGDLRIESAPGNGCCVTIELPKEKI